MAKPIEQDGATKRFVVETTEERIDRLKRGVVNSGKRWTSAKQWFEENVDEAFPPENAKVTHDDRENRH
jgi:hypothetical protein